MVNFFKIKRLANNLNLVFEVLKGQKMFNPIQTHSFTGVQKINQVLMEFL